MSIDHLDPKALPGARDDATPSVRRIRVTRRLGSRRILIDVEVPGRGGPARVEVLRHGESIGVRDWRRLEPGHHLLRVRLARGVLAGPALVLTTVDARTTPPERIFVPAR